LICYGETKVLKVRYALIKAYLVEIQRDRDQYLFEATKSGSSSDPALKRKVERKYPERLSLSYKNLSNKKAVSY